ncbi:hypothetical protein SAMN06265222_107198 [Neorhodopirellula lusitana]|uniref:Uncharacterized protein n=1 Tax=Neorhodopirellula lusitana TaxID=445327 RepID=A0ABY1QBL3_9BACT|nr:hypothetical protein [Neorhodopirellula lusitana]SMP61958.1 hypothetical protein SAMN06265222_107198 [Neorhodopirellula lusitana]
MPYVHPLSPETLKHWQLLASPFSSSRSLEESARPEEFYFRSGGHAELWCWFANCVELDEPLSVILAPSGAGVTTFFRQALTSTGIGNQAIEVLAGPWNQPASAASAEPMKSAACPPAEQLCRRVRLINAPPMTSPIPTWPKLRELADAYRSECLFIRIRTETRLGIVNHSHRTFRMSQPTSDQLESCFSNSLRHVGAVREIFSADAIARLARESIGYMDLATRVHEALTIGHLEGLHQIGLRDVQRMMQPEVRRAA